MKSLKEESSWPSGIGVKLFSGVAESWFSRTERMACVPQAFWIVWFAKKRESVSRSGGANVPSVGEVLSLLFALGEGLARRYLKRKITP